MRKNDIRRFFSALLAAVIVTAAHFPVLAEESAGETQTENAPVSYHVTNDVYRCGPYLYRVLEDGTAELVEYVCEDEITVIPDTIAGYPVTVIGPGAFSEQGYRGTSDDDQWFTLRRNIVRVQIPEGVTRIGDRVFEGCDSLMEVYLPDSLRSIGRGAFADCPVLMRVSLPEGLEELGDYAFQGCHTLSRQNLPAALRVIGANPFADCSHLTRLDVAENHPFLRYENGLLTDQRQNKLICCTKAAWAEAGRVPDGIEIIGDSAFFAAPFATIDLPDSLTVIESLAFAGCKNLLEVTLPLRVARIGDNPFRGCAALQSLRLSDEQTAFSLRDGALIDEKESRLIAYLPPSLPMKETENVSSQDAGTGAQEEDFFCYGVKMKRLTGTAYRYDSEEKTGTGVFSVPEGIREIAGSAFYGADLQEILLPDSVLEIGPEAFAACELLERCSLPEKLAAIPDRLFCDCKSLKSVSIPEGITSIGAYAFYQTGVARLDLPDSVETIGEYAFAYCREMEEIILSQGIESIPRGAFLLCSRLHELALPDSVTEIGIEAFSYCGVQSLDLPERLTAIREWCFYCSWTTEIILPPSVTYIGNYAFSGNGYNSSAVEAVRFNQTLQYIGDYAFWYADYLSDEIVLPDSLTYLGVYAFKGCRQLEKVTFGKGLAKIPSHAFQGTGLIETVLPENIIEIEDYAFSGCDFSVFEMPRSVARIGVGAFYHCSCLETVILPDSAVQIDGNPFGRCSALLTVRVSPAHPNLIVEDGFLIDQTEHKLICSLRTLETCVIPDGIQIIAASAFEDQYELREVVFPQGLLRIEDRAFCICESLKTLHLPESLQWIGDRTFYCCDLDGLILPDHVQWIGEAAFCLSHSYQNGQEELALPASLKGIGAEAFKDWDFVRLILPEGLEWIGNKAFSSRYGHLSQVVFSNHPITLDGNPFYRQSPQIILPEDHPTLELSDGNLYSRTEAKLIAQFTDAPIREGTQEIGPHALAIWDHRIVLPGSIAFISALNRTWSEYTIDSYIIEDKYLYMVPGSASEAYLETVLDHITMPRYKW